MMAVMSQPWQMAELLRGGLTVRELLEYQGNRPGEVA
jgi:hypothetical protein